jgi:hypothetical protein
MSETPENDRLVTIGRYFSTAEAHAHRLALEEAGIDACVLDDSVGAMYGVAIGARLQVRAADENAALEVLQADPVPGSELPEDLAEPPCPSCGSADVSQTAEIPEVPPPSAEEWPSRVWRYRCSACQHSWLADETAPTEQL